MSGRMIAVLKSTIIWQYKARFDTEEYIHVGISISQILGPCSPPLINAYFDIGPLREALWSSGRALALNAARPPSIPVGGENY